MKRAKPSDMKFVNINSMNLIIAPGNSPKHKEWASLLKEQLSPLFEEIRVLEYSHWGTEREILDFDKELEALTALSQGLKEYCVLGKSAGTLLTMRGVVERKLTPKVCLFLGVPFTWARTKGVLDEKWVKQFSTRTTIIQQDSDYTCSSQDLKQQLNEYEVINWTLKSIPGHDHDYSDWDMIRNEMAVLLS